MIESITLENFKSHRSTHLTFDKSRLHALVGQNSSGKTSVLEALHYMSQLTTRRIDSIFSHNKSPEFITTFNKRIMNVTIKGNLKDFPEIKWKSFYRHQKTPSKWQSSSNFCVNNKGFHLYELQQNIMKQNLKDIIPNFLKSSVYLKLTESDLKKAAYSEKISPELENDGLAPTLDYIRNEASENFQMLKEMLKKIVPTVKDIGIRRAKVALNRQRSIEVNGKLIPYEENQELIGQEVILDMNTGERLPAHLISEGTMLALGLLTVLMHPKQPNLVLLDDIEQGLHPKAQRELMDVLKEILKSNENLQIILSTHSPYIIDELNPSQVHVLNNTHSGFTVTKRLDEHPDIEWAKKTLTTGEFWDAEGEEWVVGSEVSE
ncbi:AAA family ATPase [Oscillatoriales cyanobacterium LEGE 11467]|uniref:AAA family ATPase n=1 Tax=Zarconia navalis LEGE 11467 TaxID=1828826 RepID=A0A928VZ12_9CYAN|nr:ATP-binding protein [Zarconia navalis]MBE9040906.1 AAA family ATPase [Zarconia navalis LEGE 11467]